MTAPTTFKLTITSVSATVHVADERGTVAGARVELRGPVDWQGGDVIPREGESRDCWIDGDILSYIRAVCGDDVSAKSEIIRELAYCADAGADGRQYATTVEVDPEA